MLIYKQYDQAALDRQYNNRLQVPGFAIHLQRWELLSRQAEKKYQPVKDIPYGKLERECLDIYPSSRPGAKTLVFIHGGYWQRMNKTDFHFIVQAFRPHHITTVFVGYPLAPFVAMDQIVASCQAALQWVQENIQAYNGNAGEVYVAGHSAGGHLATMLMSRAWKRFRPFNAVFTLSGLFNLAPVQLSEINSVLKMDAGTAVRNSPVRLQPLVKCPLVITVGEDETNEFKDQSREMYAAWEKMIPAKLVQVPALNHFSIVEALADTRSSLHLELLKLMKIGSIL